MFGSPVRTKLGTGLFYSQLDFGTSPHGLSVNLRQVFWKHTNLSSINFC